MNKTIVLLALSILCFTDLYAQFGFYAGGNSTKISTTIPDSIKAQSFNPGFDIGITYNFELGDKLGLEIIPAFSYRTVSWKESDLFADKEISIAQESVFLRTNLNIAHNVDENLKLGFLAGLSFNYNTRGEFKRDYNFYDGTVIKGESASVTYDSSDSYTRQTYNIIYEENTDYNQLVFGYNLGGYLILNDKLQVRIEFSKSLNTDAEEFNFENRYLNSRLGLTYFITKKND